MIRGTVRLAEGARSKMLIAKEKAFLANNYSPVPVVFARAKGVQVIDADKKEYIDFLSGYGAVNQGHMHPRIVKKAIAQLRRLTLSSRAFHADNLAGYAKFITKFFGYDRVLPMNTGAEAVETALKLARKWGYQVKGIPKNKALIVCCRGCFHGRTLGAISLSDDPESYGGYGPNVPGILKVNYGDLAQLEATFKRYPKNIAGFIVEPIQGEAGIIIPPANYLKGVQRLCRKYNVLFIADEIQSGLGRTGKMLASEGVKPDVVLLGKALSGGLLPVSAVLAKKSAMDVFTPGTHGSTFGGNPLANAVAVESLRVLREEKLPQKAAKQGKLLLARLESIKANHKIVTAVRCRGLFAAIDVSTKVLGGKGAYLLMKMLAKDGLLTKTTHGHTLRLSPPLVISTAQLNRALDILEAGVARLEELATTKK